MFDSVDFAALIGDSDTFGIPTFHAPVVRTCHHGKHIPYGKPEVWCDECERERRIRAHFGELFARDRYRRRFMPAPHSAPAPTYPMTAVKLLQ